MSVVLRGPQKEVANVTLGQYFINCLRQRHNDDIINIDAITGKTQTSGQLLEDIIKLVQILKTFGLAQNDVIAIISENNIKYNIPLLAAFCMGIIANLLNPAYGLEELRHAFLLSRPKIVFCSYTVLANIEKLMNELGFIQTVILIEPDDRSTSNLDTLLSRIRTVDFDTFLPECFDVTIQGAVILQSSGTTGMPKGVLITHQNMMYSLNYLGDPQVIGLKSGDTVSLVIPVFHIFGLLISLTTIFLHTRAVILQKLHVGVFLSSIDRYQVNKLQLVPTILGIFADDDKLQNYDLSSIEDILVSGALISNDDIHEVSRRFPKINFRETYGLTEATGACTCFKSFPKPQNCVGLLVPNMEAKVSDTNSGTDLTFMQVGEICFKGPMIMKHYFGNHCSSQDNDGFFHTGDLGYYDKDNFWYLVGRIKDIIKYKGFQVSPYEIERLLLTHSGIEDCAVIGISDKRAGQVAMAFIVAKKDCQVSEQEIVEYVSERISIQKRLHGGIRFINKIPKTATGKILRKKLEELFEVEKK